MERRLFEERLRSARRVLLRCTGRRGVYAGLKRYRYECWTRDFALAALDALLDLGLAEHARRHLEETARRQGEDGQIPVMYVANLPAFVLRRGWEIFAEPRRFLAQVRLYLKTVGSMAGFSFANLTPWSADCEPLFIVACYRFAERTGDLDFIARMRPHIVKALQYLERNSVRDGFLRGGDWRDTIGTFKDAALLSNNTLLYAAYAAAGEVRTARELKRRIREHFWNGSYYRDRLGSDQFDTFGQSIAVLAGVVSQEDYAPILRQYARLEHSIGFAVNDIAPQEIEPLVLSYVNQYRTVWPFVHGFAILALERMGEREWALREFAKWNNMPGFCEWYDPNLGGTCEGEHEQMWSAALFLRTYRTLFPRDELEAQESATLPAILFFPRAVFA